jgi:hypothetical protein
MFRVKASMAAKKILRPCFTRQMVKQGRLRLRFWILDFGLQIGNDSKGITHKRTALGHVVPAHDHRGMEQLPESFD